MELCYANNKKSLFRKYAKLVTWFANTKQGQELLGLTEPVELFLPNGYHKRLSRNKFKAIFYTRAIYSPIITPALRQLDLMQYYLQSFEEAQKVFMWAMGFDRKSLLPQLIANQLFAVLTVNPNAHPESTSVDGKVRNTVSSQPWATIRGAATGTGADDSDAGTDTWAPLMRQGTLNTWNILERFFCLFDTSSLTSVASKESATCTVRGLEERTAVAYNGIRLVTSTPASNTALATADFDQLGTTAQASDISQAAATGSGDNVFTLNATGLGNVSLTGITKFGITSVSDADDAEPSWTGENNDGGLKVDTAEGTNKPALAVTYSLPGGYIFIQA